MALSALAKLNESRAADEETRRAKQATAKRVKFIGDLGGKELSYERAILLAAAGPIKRRRQREGEDLASLKLLSPEKRAVLHFLTCEWAVPCWLSAVFNN